MKPILQETFDLQRTFAVLSLATITVISAASGYILFRFLSDNLLERDMRVSSEFIQSVSQINNPEPYFRGSTQPRDRHQLEEFFRHITQIPEVLRATVYDANQSIIWSDKEDLIGKRFTDNDELRKALRGDAVFKLEDSNDVAKLEHRFFPPDVTEFVESYLPIWDSDRRQVIGVIELYKAPTALFETLRHGRWLVFIVSAIGGASLYFALFWVVRRASRTIENQSSELRDRVQQLSELLEQNQLLHTRVRRASSRAVELNEQFLRRVGAELHDGPAQALGLALLRLEAISKFVDNEERGVRTKKEFETIRAALQDALLEIRGISSGLVLPDLAQLTLLEVIQKVVRTHEKRTTTRVALQLGKLPDDSALPFKICTYRFIQEALNNAYRHGKAKDQRVEARLSQSLLEISVSDTGPGFEPSILADGNHRLGLVGLRERIESLGGHFFVASSLGSGALVTASLPVGGIRTHEA